MHWFVGSLFHWAIDSLIHWFTESWVHCCIQSLIFYSLNHELIDSLIYWFIDSSIHRFMGSLVGWFIDSFFIGSLIHRFIGSLLHISTTTCSFLDAPHNFNRPWFLHLKNVPIGHWFLIVISYFRNFRPGACQILSGRWYIAIHKAGINGSPAYQCYH